MEERIKFPVLRADTFPQHVPRTDDRSGLTYHDKYVIHYDFSEAGTRTKGDSIKMTRTANSGIDMEQAMEEVQRLCNDVIEVGLQCEVRAGEDQSLLVFVRAPQELLNSEIHKSRQVQRNMTQTGPHAIMMG